MLLVYTSSWWALVLRGIVAILFGILAFVWPQITLTALVLLWGAYALVDGAFAIAAGVKSYGENKRWWLLLIQGLLGVVAGVLAFVIPGITALVLLMLIAAWAIVTGSFQIAAAIQLRKHITGEWLLALGGVASIIFGVLLFLNPGAGALAVVWLIGAYSIVFGSLLIALGLRLHGMVKPADRMTPRAV
ncbi:MAG TPA: HdeD family acid-resistance protein [Pyrinomonadaceae bacterium]|nr:HdeD family acid-resistance protein [Pyrinomonadaceae bacterium]